MLEFAGGVDLMISAQQADVLSQPGDGQCLFHCLTWHLVGETHVTVRQQIALTVRAKPLLMIGGLTLEQLISNETGETLSGYCSRMELADTGNWGGAVELAAFAEVQSGLVLVFERAGGDYRCIASFGRTATSVWIR